ncbi:MAG: nucleotidyltransferase family protein [Rhodanobacteraceae bacterium]
MTRPDVRQALILSAGLGRRMRPLSDCTPKPLLEVGGKRLIEWHLEKLATAGVRNVVINTSYLAEQFPAALGNGERWGIAIRYSHEGPKPLETGGGMHRALSLLSDAPFIAVAADIWSDFDYATLPVQPTGLAHLVMVPNPAFHPAGDFWLDGARLNEQGNGEKLTFASIGVYRPEFIAAHAPDRFPLLPLYQQAMRDRALTGERYEGAWRNIGTPQQLADLDAHLDRTGR